jgi:hypothetical protein
MLALRNAIWASICWRFGRPLRRPNCYPPLRNVTCTYVLKKLCLMIYSPLNEFPALVCSLCCWTWWRTALPLWTTNCTILPYWKLPRHCVVPTVLFTAKKSTLKVLRSYIIFCIIFPLGYVRGNLSLSVVLCRYSTGRTLLPNVLCAVPTVRILTFHICCRLVRSFLLSSTLMLVLLFTLYCSKDGRPLLCILLFPYLPLP